MSEYVKYLKYKKKYLDLKLQLGGKEFTKEEIDDMTDVALIRNGSDLFKQALLNNNKELLEFLLVEKNIKYEFSIKHYNNVIREETYIKLVELLLQKKEYLNIEKFLSSIKSEKFYADFANDHKNNRYIKPSKSDIDTNSKNYGLLNSKAHDSFRLDTDEDLDKAEDRSNKVFYGTLLNTILKRTMKLYLTNVTINLAANNAEYVFEDYDLYGFIEDILKNDRRNEAEKLINTEIILKSLLPRRQDIYNSLRYDFLQKDPEGARILKIGDTFMLLIYLNYAVIYFGAKSVSLIKIFFENINLDNGEYNSRVYHRLINYLLNSCRKYNFDEALFRSYTTRENTYSPMKTNIFEGITKIILSRYTSAKLRIDLLRFLIYFYENKTISFENYNVYLSSLGMDKKDISPNLQIIEGMYKKIFQIVKKIEPQKNVKLECVKETILEFLIERRKQMNARYKISEKNRLIKTRLSIKKENIEKDLGLIDNT